MAFVLREYKNGNQDGTKTQTVILRRIYVNKTKSLIDLELKGVLYDFNDFNNLLLINTLPAFYFGRKYLNLKRISLRTKILKDYLIL